MPHIRQNQVPKNCGGSYTPSAGARPRKYVLKEKIGEMLKYGLPQVSAFSGRDQKLAKAMQSSMYELYRQAVKLDYVKDKKSIVENLHAELAALKALIVLASDNDFYAKPFSPPLSLKKREVWGTYNSDIEIMLESLQ